MLDVGTGTGMIEDTVFSELGPGLRITQESGHSTSVC